jgi:hypothetical protein
MNYLAVTVTQDRPAASRARVTHPVGVLAQHRHQVSLALVAGHDDGEGDRPAGPPAGDFKHDELVRPETGSWPLPGPVHQARQMVRVLPRYSHRSKLCVSPTATTSILLKLHLPGAVSGQLEPRIGVGEQPGEGLDPQRVMVDRTRT